MQVARTNFVNKSTAVSSAAQNTSCSRGWLRLMVQTIFAVISTFSFIAIVLMAVRSPTPTPSKTEPVPSRCIPYRCRVICNDAPYYGEYEKDILVAVADAYAQCDRVILEINNPSFENNTLPNNWLSEMRSNIYELYIIGGNLNHVPKGAFMSQFTGTTKILSLEQLNIKTWHTSSLVGLSSLETLNIVNCDIDGFQANSLQAVDDTLIKLAITKSGSWNPAIVTGTKGFDKLAIVDFSYNQFDKILSKESFVGLEHCKILYLNSCGIVSIGAGTFDHLSSIEVIYLDYNYLVTLPPGLFDKIVLLDSPRPRISLQENFWHCDCAVDDLRQLVRKEVLLVEAICTYPNFMNGKTFTELENICANESLASLTSNVRYPTNYDYKNIVFVKGTCGKNYNWKSENNEKKAFKIVSPSKSNRCSLDRSKNIDISSLASTATRIGSFNYSSWLKFSFFLKTAHYNTIHIGADGMKGYGLLWFQSDCPSELYCIDSMPMSLRIYDVDEDSQYTFCPMRLNTGAIDNYACVGYTIDAIEKLTDTYIINWLVYSTTVLLCILFGAIIVYGLIRMKPTLLKGSKRILFVKHKTVDALVLPPKVPIRNDMIKDKTNFSHKEIFTLSADDKLMLPNLNRMKSVRSNKSSSASYISALQPSEDQLAEWRISRHFNNDLTINSKSESSTLSWIRSDNSYYSFDENDRTYESLK